MPVPDFDVLKAHYPDYRSFPSPESVKRMIGGEALEKDVTNTCAMRMSHAMNRLGTMVPRTWEGIVNRRGERGWYYILRVANLRTWIAHTVGKPDLDFRKEAGKAFDMTAIEGRRGIIGFEIGFKDATGHFDLWDGATFTHQEDAGKDYFALASRISLWTRDANVRVLAAPV